MYSQVLNRSLGRKAALTIGMGVGYWVWRMGQVKIAYLLPWLMAARFSGVSAAETNG